ncbi:hypothetical protein Afil01_64080 [Actinorhabdospora filicis]|uniref:Uncharacterized protein n=1 Tax=Actinorhabdospora filicis TaxID=1785913 RepID=A0A9W6SSF6_9ACTN|nr:hypothetical protein [Actinorhabdospora filicis]GLZ81601.1 hypothetical protein Afil01_64080 [Actinorhabdospora filicis]
MAPEAAGLRADLLITRLRHSGDVTAAQTLWRLGDRFHLRDVSGRPLNQILADATGERGIGFEPRSKEEIMDTREAMEGTVDVWGDLAAGKAVVRVDDLKPVTVDVKAVLPLATGLLAGDLAGRAPGGRVRFLDRDCAEYISELSGTREGARWVTKVRTLVAGPHVLLREAVDAATGMGLRTEVTALAEGAVTSAEVTPPK